MDLVEEILASSGASTRRTAWINKSTRRCGVSVPSNIAEGQGRRTDPEFARHRLSIAHGCFAKQTQLMIGKRLGYLSEEQLDRLLEKTGEVGRLITGLWNTVSPQS
jgi:four helix bundle protein